MSQKKVVGGGWWGGGGGGWGREVGRSVKVVGEENSRGSRKATRGQK